MTAHMERNDLTFIPEFYTLNEWQDAFFPHTTCDEWTDDQLLSMAFGPHHIATYMVNKLVNSTDHFSRLIDLRVSNRFCTLLVVYLRLKFVLEILDIPRLWPRMSRLPRGLDCSTWMTEQQLEQAQWRLDVLASTVFAELLTEVLGTSSAKKINDWTFQRLVDLNKAIHGVRSVECYGYAVAGADPYELAPYPFHWYIQRLWRAVLPFVIMIDV